MLRVPFNWCFSCAVLQQGENDVLHVIYCGIVRVGQCFSERLDLNALILKQLEDLSFLHGQITILA